MHMLVVQFSHSTMIIYLKAVIYHICVPFFLIKNYFFSRKLWNWSLALFKPWSLETGTYCFSKTARKVSLNALWIEVATCLTGWRWSVAAVILVAPYGLTVQKENLLTFFRLTLDTDKLQKNTLVRDINYFVYSHKSLFHAWLCTCFKRHIMHQKRGLLFPPWNFQINHFPHLL